MNHEPDELSRRLSDAPGTLERELLRSAAADRPAPAVYEAALAAVLDDRRERVARSRRRFTSVGAALAFAAAAIWLVQGRSQQSHLAPEPSVARRAATAAPPSAPASAPAFAPCAPQSIGSGTEPLIDDFEDGDTRIPMSDKRAGVWIVYNDGTGKQEPHPGAVFPATRIPGGRGASLFGLRSSGGKFSKWGAAVAMELNPRRCYDASAYAGVGFWARGRGRIRVNVKMTQVVGEEFGGSCVKDCYDAHGAARTLTREWKRYEVRWDELAQRGFGSAMPFDPRSLYSIEFALPQNQPPFELWIDDVTFLMR